LEATGVSSREIERMRSVLEREREEMVFFFEVREKVFLLFTSSSFPLFLSKGKPRHGLPPRPNPCEDYDQQVGEAAVPRVVRGDLLLCSFCSFSL
jgi:hypothetical protein